MASLQFRLGERAHCIETPRRQATYVSILGLADARRKAQTLLEDGLSALEPFGMRARRLRELAEFITRRSF